MYVYLDLLRARYQTLLRQLSGATTTVKNSFKVFFGFEVLRKCLYVLK